MRLKDERKFAAIIEATLALTQEVGLAGIKMSTLAQRAGIATGSLYTYFEDKQDLLLSVHREVWHKGATFLRRELDASAEFEEQFLQAIDIYVDYVYQNREALLFAEQLKRSPYMTEAAISEVLAEYQFLSDLIETGKQAGRLVDHETEEIMHVMGGIVMAIIDQLIEKGQPYTQAVKDRCRSYVAAAVSR
ncbi:MAG: TetR/AcrR family transcriptional regulator [Bacteroidota bacterium]